MKTIKKVMCFAITFSLILSCVQTFGFNQIKGRPLEVEIQKNVLDEYGINIIMPKNSYNYKNIDEIVAVIEISLGRFPKGVIKETTDFYLSKGITTNILINKLDNINSLNIEPALYEMTNLSANIYVNILCQDFYGTSDIVSLDAIVHEIGNFISDYIDNRYGYELLEKEFDKLNNGYKYGDWHDGYEKVFVNINSAKSFDEDIVDLILYAENHPEKLRNIGSGKKEIIHKKIELLASVFSKSFSSITNKTKLWADAIPNKPDIWAVEIINKMQKEGFIPAEFIGKYNSNITREQFYTLSLKMIKNIIGEDEFYKYFEILKAQSSVNIDPVSGDIIVEDIITDVFYDIALSKNKQDIYEMYNIGLVDNDYNGKFRPDDFIKRIEVAKFITNLCHKFDIDISGYNLSNLYFNDINNLNENEKSYIYFCVDTGIIKGYGNSFKSDEYCTYQETFIIMNRVYDLINDKI